MACYPPIQETWAVTLIDISFKDVTIPSGEEGEVKQECYAGSEIYEYIIDFAGYGERIILAEDVNVFYKLANTIGERIALLDNIVRASAKIDKGAIGTVKSIIYSKNGLLYKVRFDAPRATLTLPGSFINKV